MVQQSNRKAKERIVKDAFLSIAIPENIKVLISIEEEIRQLVVDGI
jgi:hypothetical protein